MLDRRSSSSMLPLPFLETCKFFALTPRLCNKKIQNIVQQILLYSLQINANSVVRSIVESGIVLRVVAEAASNDRQTVRIRFGEADWRWKKIIYKNLLIQHRLSVLTSDGIVVVFFVFSHDRLFKIEDISQKWHKKGVIIVHRNVLCQTFFPALIPRLYSCKSFLVPWDKIINENETHDNSTGIPAIAKRLLMQWS